EKNKATSLLFIGIDAGKNYKPTGEYDISPAELDKLCQTIDPSYEPPSSSDPCVYMKWVNCPPGEGSGKPNEPCGWYQQTLCEGGKRRKRQNLRMSGRGSNRKPQSFVSINWPKK
ncbi:unnamed protein product, partial [Allacma fusca]